MNLPEKPAGAHRFTPSLVADKPIRGNGRRPGAGMFTKCRGIG